MEPPVTFLDDYDRLTQMAADKSKVYFIVQATRPGSGLFSVRLEYEHYPPHLTERNEQFDFLIVNWPEKILQWFVVGIPKEDFALAENSAKEAGLVIRSDSVPFMFYDGKHEIFPMSGDNVYSLESNPKSHIYKNDKAVTDKINEGEDKEIERIIKAYEESRFNV